MKTSYLSYLIELLQANDWRGVSKNVDIAKGKYQLPTSWTEYFKRR
jgi:hypothetical protein